MSGIKTLKQRDSAVLWHPYTQMKLLPESIAIVKGEGAYLIDEDGNRYLDAISSWWVNIHGHSHPYIGEKIANQFSKLEHCIFAGFTHEPAIELAEKLLPLLPGEMQKCFFSDNGSTAVEVAIKMALQYHQNIGSAKHKIIALDGAYHGDTFGAMSVSSRSLFTSHFNALLFDTIFIPFPTKNNEEELLRQLQIILDTGAIAAFIVEPLVQGSAGMRMYDKSILEKIIAICNRHDCLVIADEVMTGFGRTGNLFACDTLIDAKPDIICLSKGLTGGVLPLGITASTKKIFDAFYSNDTSKTLYHGHSYTANPLACSAALASLDLLLEKSCMQSILSISNQHIHQVKRWRNHKSVKDIRCCGTILAIELETGESTNYLNNKRDFIYSFFIERKIILRPLGNILYILPPYCITNIELTTIYDEIEMLLNTI